MGRCAAPRHWGRASECPVRGAEAGRAQAGLLFSAASVPAPARGLGAGVRETGQPAHQHSEMHSAAGRPYLEGSGELTERSGSRWPTLVGSVLSPWRQWGARVGVVCCC